MDDTGRLTGGKLGEYATGATGGRERPLSEVVRDIIGNIQEMVRGEVKLAKAEVREETKQTLAASKMLAAGAAIGLYGGFFVLLALVYGLSQVVPPWAAALIVGVVLSGVAYGMITGGQKALADLHPAPERTVESVKENVEWMKDRTK